MDYIAHIREKDNAEQTVAAHCEQTAKLAGDYADKLGLRHTAWLAGALHDIGKYTNDFNRYIHGDTSFHRGELDHSFAGARLLDESAQGSDDKILQKTASLIGRIIISHHGLNDWITGDGKDTYKNRVEKNEYYNEIMANLSECHIKLDVNSMLRTASSEVGQVRSLARQLSKNSEETFAFYLGMLERLLQSVLIDADRTDTANFMSDKPFKIQRDTQALWQNMRIAISRKLEEFSKRTDPISKQRRDISDRCALFSEHEVHICKLVVPTGGGKTLSSLRFAVEYAKRYNKEKIVYIAPFKSILKQNSDIIREITGEENFLEHHSDMLSKKSGNDKELQDYELHTEKWDLPVIATTLVQFLNALFSGNTGAVRRMHRLSDAVIIIDEVQSVPLKCVYLFNLAINFLAHICGSTVVLCSATQPRFEKLTEFPLLLDENSSMTGDTTVDFKIFKRTELHYHEQSKPGGYSYDEAAEFCLEKFRGYGSLLCVVNTKSSARELYRRLRDTKDASVFHLSTNMCPEHQREVIDKMTKMLGNNEPVICVTTQLIEAGVDISFGCVVRSLAGMDNAAQAAGRCNRNGEFNKVCPVYILELWEEKLGNLKEIKKAQDVSRQILYTHENTDYLSVSVQSDYFEEYYRETGNVLRYPVKETDMGNLLNLLSLNKYWVDSNKKRKYSGQAFKTAGRLFRVIDNDTTDVIVPFNDAAERLISDLEKEKDPHETLKTLRRAQVYSVSIYENTMRGLEDNAALRELDCGAVVLDKRFYNSEYGVITEGGIPEVLMY